jgi:hypothetical protein
MRSKCFSKAQKETMAKSMAKISAALQEVMQEVKALEPEELDEALAGVFGSWQVPNPNLCSTVPNLDRT